MAASHGTLGRYRFGFDIGGTFTDFVLIDTQSGRVASYKTPTTPRDPAQAVMEGWYKLLEDLGTDGDRIETAIHGTTLITNALIERKGATTAFVTTKGFRDVLEMGKEMRYDIYDLLIVLPKPLVPRSLSYEVVERLNGRGEVVIPIQVSDLEALVPNLLENNVEAIAVCFLHSFTNPVHEQAAGQWLREELPQLSVS